MARPKGEQKETRDGVELSHLNDSLFDGSEATKRDLVDYFDAMSDRLIPVLEQRPLSVIRVHRGETPFMQKNLPKYAPDWIQAVTTWAPSSKRDVRYALCNDRQTLLWFANQRAVELHPALSRVEHPDRNTHLVLDLDPPPGDTFPAAVAAAMLVRQVLDEVGLEAAVKTSGAKGVHVFVPIDEATTPEAAAAATRAIARRAVALDPSITTDAFLKEDRDGRVFVDATRAGGATVVAAYSPRARPGVPVSFPVGWDDLERVSPGDFTIHNVADLLSGRDPWAEGMPAPQQLPAALVEEGSHIAAGRVEAMHEGKRRRRTKG